MSLLQYPNKICGIKIDTDFKFWLHSVGAVLDAIDLHMEEKGGLVIDNVFFANRFVLGMDDEQYLKYLNKLAKIDTKELLAETLQFYNCGKEERGLRPPSEPLLHWGKDMYNIRSDFLLHYKVDLNAPKTKLHWWEFHSMFESLPPDSKIKTLISIRNEDVGDYKGKGQQKAREACKERKRAAAVWPDYDIDYMS